MDSYRYGTGMVLKLSKCVELWFFQINLANLHVRVFLQVDLGELFANVAAGSRVHVAPINLGTIIVPKQNGKIEVSILLNDTTWSQVWFTIKKKNLVDLKMDLI